MVAKIKSGDLVKVIRGKDRGKEGTVKRVLKDNRLIVEGVQMVKKHVRATQQGQQSGIVSVEAPIHRSNVMLSRPGDQAADSRWRCDQGRGPRRQGEDRARARG